MTVIELKERYVYAATRRLPNKARHDIAKELDTLIDDMLLERCGDNIPEEKDLRVVFAEIGQPSEIHRKYSPRADKSLIAPPYYEPYAFVMKIVAACVFSGITIAIAVSSIVNGQPALQAIFTWLTTLATSLCISFSFTTILFAILSQKGVDLREFDNEINNLQPVPKTNLRISKGESIVNIVFAIIFAVLFLAVPQIFITWNDGQLIPIFNTNALRSAWPWIILFVGYDICLCALSIIDGKYTKRILYATYICFVINILCSAMIFLRQNVINIDLFASSSTLPNLFISNFNIYILGLIVVVSLIDIGTTTYKYLKTINIAF